MIPTVFRIKSKFFYLVCKTLYDRTSVTLSLLPIFHSKGQQYLLLAVPVWASVLFPFFSFSFAWSELSAFYAVSIELGFTPSVVLITLCYNYGCLFTPLEYKLREDKVLWLNSSLSSLPSTELKLNKYLLNDRYNSLVRKKLYLLWEPAQKTVYNLLGVQMGNSMRWITRIHLIGFLLLGILAISNALLL